MIHFFFLIDHFVLIHHIYSIYFLLNVARVVCFGSGQKLIESCLHYVIVIQDIVIISLVAVCQMIESLAVFIFHLFLNAEVSAFGGFVLKIYVAKIWVIDIHFTDSSEEFGSIQSCFCLIKNLLYLLCWFFFCKFNEKLGNFTLFEDKDFNNWPELGEAFINELIAHLKSNCIINADEKNARRLLAILTLLAVVIFGRWVIHHSLLYDK